MSEQQSHSKAPKNCCCISCMISTSTFATLFTYLHIHVNMHPKRKEFMETSCLRVLTDGARAASRIELIPSSGDCKRPRILKTKNAPRDMKGGSSRMMLVSTIPGSAALWDPTTSTWNEKYKRFRRQNKSGEHGMQNRYGTRQGNEISSHKWNLNTEDHEARREQESHTYITEIWWDLSVTESCLRSLYVNRRRHTVPKDK